MAQFRLPARETLAAQASYPPEQNRPDFASLEAAASGLSDESVGPGSHIAGASLESALAAACGATSAVVTNSYVAAIRLLLGALASAGATWRLADQVDDLVAAVLDDMAEGGHIRTHEDSASTVPNLVLHAHLESPVVDTPETIHVLLAGPALLSQLDTQRLPYSLVVANLIGLDGSEEAGGVILDSGRTNWVGHPVCDKAVRPGLSASFADEHGRLALMVRLKEFDRPLQGCLISNRLSGSFMQAIPQRLCADAQRTVNRQSLLTLLEEQQSLPCELRRGACSEAEIEMHFADNDEARVFCQSLRLLTPEGHARRDSSMFRVPAIMSAVLSARANSHSRGRVVLSLGLESPGDILEDIQRGLRQVSKRREQAQ